MAILVNVILLQSLSLFSRITCSWSMRLMMPLYAHNVLCLAKQAAVHGILCALRAVCFTCYAWH